MLDGDGHIVQHNLNSPYRESLERLKADEASDPMLHQVGGHSIDLESGCYWQGARYYCPEFGLWKGVDPLTAFGGYMSGRPNNGLYNSNNVNGYSYSFNNPIVFTDTTGLAPGQHYDNMDTLQKDLDADINTLNSEAKSPTEYSGVITKFQDSNGKTKYTYALFKSKKVDHHTYTGAHGGKGHSKPFTQGSELESAIPSTGSVVNEEGRVEQGKIDGVEPKNPTIKGSVVSKFHSHPFNETSSDDAGTASADDETVDGVAPISHEEYLKDSSKTRNVAVRENVRTNVYSEYLINRRQNAYKSRNGASKEDLSKASKYGENMLVFPGTGWVQSIKVDFIPVQIDGKLRYHAKVSTSTKHIKGE